MSSANIDKYDPKRNIIIKNVRQNNLKNVDVAIPHNKVVVITGVSGSGKSSLAFETLYEEGRRRYVESLSSYVRQFLGKIRKPLVDHITGLPPAIAIEQKRSSSNSRSTVGTVTEIYDYLKLLYARIGKTYSPVSGKQVKKQSIDDVVDFVSTLNPGTQIKILSPLVKDKSRNWIDEIAVILQKGYSRLYIKGQILKTEELLERLELESKGKEADNLLNGEIFILIDRIKVDEEGRNDVARIADSVQTALYEGKQRCCIETTSVESEVKLNYFSNSFDLDGVSFEEPNVDLFGFNSPHGACKNCGGMGDIIGIDNNKVIPNKNMSLYDGAVSCWEGEKMSKWKARFINKSAKYDFPIFRSYNELTNEEKDLLWNGNKEVKGINAFFEFVESKSYKIHYRIFLSRFKGKTVCNECKGVRLRKEANYVKIAGRAIGELVLLPVSELYKFFRNIKLDKVDIEVAERLLYEVSNRLEMMLSVGLGYLNLNRTTRSLSGGELQRIQLIYSIGSNLTGALYILDEPSIGLHPRDSHQLIKVMNRLRDLGNTVVVVEHDEEIIRAADEIIDLGPAAGSEGGEIVFKGSLKELLKNNSGVTGRYLNGENMIPLPEREGKVKAN